MYKHTSPPSALRSWRVALHSIVRCGHDFCLSTSVHGFNHIATPGRMWIERVLWICIVLAAIWGAVDISLGQWTRYNDSPTVVALEKDFRSWDFNLPGITVCNKNRVDPKKLPAVIAHYWSVGTDDEKYPYYSDFVHAVANSDLLHLEDLQNFSVDDETLDVDLFQLVIDVAPELSLKVTWSQPRSVKWTQVMTEAGVCYVTNSLPIQDVALQKVEVNDTALFPLTCKYTSLSCYVTFEVSLHMHFYIHSPYDVMDISSKPSTGYPTLNRVTVLSVMETGCGRGVRELSPRRRGCLYNDEPTEGGRKVYSTNTCRRSCRNRLALEKCDCRPFYNFYDEGKACTLKGMQCLSKYAQSLTSPADARWQCNPQCQDAVFKEISMDEQIWERGPFINQGSVRFTVQAPRTRYTREIVFHFQDLVVSFGGAAGLYLGASFISFVEIFYFLLERILGLFSPPDQKSQAVQEKEPKVPYEEARIRELTEILQEQKELHESEREIPRYIVEPALPFVK